MIVYQNHVVLRRNSSFIMTNCLNNSDSSQWISLEHLTRICYQLDNDAEFAKEYLLGPKSYLKSGRA